MNRLRGWQAERRGFLPLKTEDDSDVESRCSSCANSSTHSLQALEKGLAPLSPDQRPKHNRHLYLLTGINILILTITISVATWGAPWRLSSSFSPAPFLRSISDTYHQVRLNGTLWPGNDPAWSRREPGDPEGEKMWKSYENMISFPISREDVVALGKDPETAARFPDEVFGLGDEAYIASLDVQHKIHCLNELRKVAFKDYGLDEPARLNHTRLWWVHLRHCTDMLLQDLVCHADPDVNTYRWVDTQPQPFPDFAINRQCRSLDDLLAYRDKHAINMTAYTTMKKPKTGVKTVPMEPAYYADYGFGHSELYPDGRSYDGPLPSQDALFGNAPEKDIKDKFQVG